MKEHLACASIMGLYSDVLEGKTPLVRGPVALPVAETPVPFFEQYIAGGVSQFR